LIHAVLSALIVASLLLYQLLSLSWLLWAALAAALGALFFALGRRRREGAESGESAGAEGQPAFPAEEREELHRRIAEKDGELRRLREELEERRRQLAGFARQCVLVGEGSEAEGRLSEVIMDKTEKATLELTDHVYTIGESSKRVGQLINEVLGQLTRGAGGLGDDVQQIERELETIKSLIATFASIRDGYRREFDEVQKTLGSVDTFTATIGDLAERTNILAINASIEAARAGNAGEGFAVIAGEVQQLARSTQEVAGEINSAIEEAVRTVSDAVEKYGSQIQEAVGSLEKTGEAHSRLIERLNPQVSKLSGIAQESQELSETVTENLNEVTVHLQYQDTVRQILEHMVSLFDELSRRGREMTEQLKLTEAVDREETREEVRTLLANLFSTREEWNAFGYTLEEKVEGTERPDYQESLEGDITLF
jgi:methyl-accepting chemotaxis protein